VPTNARQALDAEAGLLYCNAVNPTSRHASKLAGLLHIDRVHDKWKIFLKMDIFLP
jgi:hypothetical protein